MFFVWVFSPSSSSGAPSEQQCSCQRRCCVGFHLHVLLLIGRLSRWKSGLWAAPGEGVRSPRGTSVPGTIKVSRLCHHLWPRSLPGDGSVSFFYVTNSISVIADRDEREPVNPSAASFPRIIFPGFIAPPEPVD